MREEDPCEVFKLRGVFLRIIGLLVNRLVCLAQPKFFLFRGFGERV